MSTGIVDAVRIRTGVEQIISAIQLPRQPPQQRQQSQPSEAVRKFIEGLRAIAEGGGIPLNHHEIKSAEDAARTGRMPEAYRHARNVIELVGQRAQTETTPAHSALRADSQRGSSGSFSTAPYQG